MARRRTKAAKRKAARKAAERELEQNSPIRQEPTGHQPIPKKLAGKSHELIGSAPLDRPRRARRGHPARRTREDKRREWFVPQDPREVATREHNRVHREELKASPETDGILAGAIAAVARLAVEEHAKVLGVSEAEHKAAMAQMLKAKIGAAIATFDVEEYEAWRRETRERAALIVAAMYREGNLSDPEVGALLEAAG